MADTFESFTEVEIGIHWSLLVHQGNCVTIEAYQVG